MLIRQGSQEYAEAQELRDRLALTGEDPGLVRKLDALLSQNYLKGSEAVKLLKLIGRKI